MKKVSSKNLANALFWLWTEFIITIFLILPGHEKWFLVDKQQWSELPPILEVVAIFHLPVQPQKQPQNENFLELSSDYVMIEEKGWSCLLMILCTEKMVFFKIVTKSRFVTKYFVTKSRLHWTTYVIRIGQHFTWMRHQIMNRCASCCFYLFANSFFLQLFEFHNWPWQIFSHIAILRGQKIHIK